MMKLWKILRLIGVSLACIGWNWGDGLARNAQHGNALFEAGQYDEALQAYTEADVSSAPDDPRLSSLYQNMGNTLFQQGNHEHATAMYQKTVELTEDARLQADALYNTGNAWFKQGDYQQAVEAYTQALELNSDHQAAQQNKALVEKLLAEPPPQQQKQEQQQQDQQQQQQQKQEQAPEQQDEEQQQQEQASQDEEQQAEAHPQSAEEQQQQLSEEEALRILDALKEKEELQQQPVQLPPRPVEKDW